MNYDRNKRLSFSQNLLFFGFLGFTIALLLTFGHADLLWFDDVVVFERRNLCQGVIRRAVKFCESIIVPMPLLEAFVRSMV